MADQTNRPAPDQKSDDAVIDHVADITAETPAEDQGERQDPLTPAGQPVEKQVRKEWDPKKKGGLPTFFPDGE
jgi:hypothetical protein